MNITEAVLQLCFQFPEPKDGAGGPCLHGEDLLLLCLRQDGENSPGELVPGCTGYLPEIYEKVCTKQEFLAECERIGKAYRDYGVKVCDAHVPDLVISESPDDYHPNNIDWEKAPADATHAGPDANGNIIWFKNVSFEAHRAQFSNGIIGGRVDWYNCTIDGKHLIQRPRSPKPEIDWSKAPRDATHAHVKDGGEVMWIKSASSASDFAHYCTQDKPLWKGCDIRGKQLIPRPYHWPKVGDVVEYRYGRDEWYRGRVVGFDGTERNPDLYVVLSVRGFEGPAEFAAPTYRSYQRSALRDTHELDEATIREAIEIIRPYAGNGAKIQELARRGYLKRPEKKG